MPQSLQTQTVQPISWSAKEYHAQEKTPDWFWALGVLAVLGAIAAILFNNVLLALLILLGAFIVAMYAMKDAPENTFMVSGRGLQIDDTLYPYQNLVSFWIEADNPEERPRLFIRSRNFLTQQLIIPLVGVDLNELHTQLLRFLPEEEQQEPVTYRIIERLGF